MNTGVIFDFQCYSIHDGPGIRSMCLNLENILRQHGIQDLRP